MKVVGLCASPRANGNTRRLLEHFLTRCHQLGAETVMYSSSEHKIDFCLACEACMRQGTCPVDDDYLTLLPTILKADALVLATPNYAFDMSAQLKAVIDRSHAFLYYAQALSGKYGVGLCVGGHPAMTHQIAKRLGQAVWLCGGNYVGALAGLSKHRDKKGLVNERELFKRADQLAAKLIQNISRKKNKIFSHWLREIVLVAKLKKMLRRRSDEYTYSAKQLLGK